MLFASANDTWRVPGLLGSVWLHVCCHGGQSLTVCLFYLLMWRTLRDHWNQEDETRKIFHGSFQEAFLVVSTGLDSVLVFYVAVRLVNVFRNADARADIREDEFLHMLSLHDAEVRKPLMFVVCEMLRNIV